MLKKNYHKLGIFAVFTSLILANIFLLPISILAQTPTDTPTPTSVPDTSGKLNEIKDKIKELEGRVNDLVAKEKSLASEISVMDNQIKLTELRIRATENEIGSLEKDISIAEDKIINLEGSLDKIMKVLLNRIVATYQISSIQPIQILMGSSDVSNFISRANYLKIAQENDKKLMYNTVQAKNDYENQKDIFEQKKQKIEQLKKELIIYAEQIENDKKAKDELLRVTKNDEQKYQSLLDSARAERAAMEGVFSSFRLVDGTPVSKGQVIAVVGNSGAPYCSTGAHLHFAMKQNGAAVNPGNYLRGGINYSYSYESGQYGYYGTISTSGDWDWPLEEPIRINQAFGSHGFAQSFYANGMHDGYDMDSTSSSLIKAPKDGTLYKGSTSCRSATMNFVAVDHGGGIVSWYFHVK